MKQSKRQSYRFGVGLLLAYLLLSAAAALADDQHRVAIQVSTDDPITQAIALNNAVNLQKLYGMDNVAIEIVAFGPGLGLMTDKSSQADRVTSLALQDIIFSACGNTMEKVKQKSGKTPVLLEGVGVVQAGAARLIELQEQGWSYLRP